MTTQELTFAVITQDGVVITVGCSTIEQPATDYKGVGIKWYPEERKERKK